MDELKTVNNEINTINLSTKQITTHTNYTIFFYKKHNKCYPLLTTTILYLNKVFIAQ